MTDPRICPNCREAIPADAPAGVCPACALRAGFDVTNADAAAPDPTAEADPALRDDLARALPELDGFEHIGRGGMGHVFRARHRRLDRPVAVKVLDATLRDTPGFPERFEREARTLAQLDHPNIVRVYDFGHREGLYYLVMELIDGVNLRQTIQAGRLAPAEALALVPQICDALQYAHDHDVVHRDVKPENILLDRNGMVHIADFGLARLVGASSAPHLTRTRQVMGTPNYMAPEQIERPDQVDHRADIFALGVVFYELLTGELPVGRFPAPSQRVQVDVRLDEVVLRTLEKEPGLRYQQASELRTDVESISTSTNGSARASSTAASQGKARPSGEDADYEFRSTTTIMGLPLLHIAHSGDSSGQRMRVARGIIAIGDVAIGGLAIGGISFGALAFGGMSVGLFGFGGITAGLLAAVGGIAFGALAIGGFAMGLVATGPIAVAAMTVGSDVLSGAALAAWLIPTVGVTLGVTAAIYAWAAARAPDARR